MTTNIIATPTRWIRYSNNSFVGSPQPRKGLGDGWIQVISLGSKNNDHQEEFLVKDEIYDICYAVYGPKGATTPSVDITAT